MIYFDIDKYRTVFYNIQQTFQNLELIDKRESIVPQALANFIVSYCPDAICEESDLYVDVIDEDPEQLAAIHEVEGVQCTHNLMMTMSRLFLR